ncbi:MAG: EamA family transporter [Thermoflavifilum aggregans]|nr:EamA family transporter [Thermoflavifilum aggregans]
MEPPGHHGTRTPERLNETHTKATFATAELFLFMYFPASLRLRRYLTPSYLAVALVSFFWGTTYPAIRVGVAHMPGLMLASVRQTLAGTLLVLFYLLKGQALPRPSEMGKLLMMGLLLLGISNGLLSWAEQYLPSGLAAIMAATCPLAIVWFSIWFLPGARFTAGLYLGMVLGLCGIAIIFSPEIFHTPTHGFLLGAGLILCSVVSWSGGTIYAARHPLPLPLLYATGWQMLLGGVTLMPICAVSGQYIPLTRVPSEAWWAIAYLIVFGSMIGYVAYVYAISTLPPAQVSVYAYINPLVAVAIGAWWLKEPVTLRTILGAGVTLGGVYLVQKSFKPASSSKSASPPAKAEIPEVRTHP